MSSLTQISFCFSWAHTDPTDLTDFFVGGKSHGLCGGLLFFCSHRSHRSHGFARLALNLTEALRTALKKRPFSHKSQIIFEICVSLKEQECRESSVRFNTIKRKIQ